MTDPYPPAYDPDPVEAERARLGTRGRTLSWVLGIGVLVLIAIGAWALANHSKSAGKGDAGGGPGAFFGGGHKGGGQATTVGTAKATNADLPVTIDALGTVTPLATATVAPQVSGTITAIRFKEGEAVHKGDVLAVIERRPYEASLLQAQGNLARDQAQLANARLLLSRYNTLAAQDSVARQDRDTQEATVHQLEGTVEADKGSVASAKVNLDFTEVRSPVDGRVGLRVADVGNYVSAGSSTGVAVVTTLQPIDIAFTVPQQQWPAIADKVHAGGQIPAVAMDQARTKTLDSGSFSTLDNRVDTTTGTIKGKARMPNPGLTLYPNQFVNVRLTVDTVKGAITVPPSAVRAGADSSFVWFLKPDRTVTKRNVTVGVQTADKVQITKGLALGDTVVTDGGDRLTEGATVRLPGDKADPAAAGKSGKGHHRRQSAG